MQDDTSRGEGRSKLLLTFLGLVPAIATAITGYLAYRVNSEVESLKAELQRIESERDFDLEIYRAVKESLKGDTRDQQVALALVVSIGRDPLRTALLETFEEAQTAAPEIIAQARGYQTAERQAGGQSQDALEDSPSMPWRDWDFDLFYCEGSPEGTRTQAENLANAMFADGAQGRIRVRPLSESKNRESAYQINGYVIYRSDDEKPMAEKLKRFAEDSNPPLSFEIRPTSQSSPWYLSAFLCPDSGV